MRFCAEYGLDMPDDFPVDELIEFMREARRVLLPPDHQPPAWREFAGASNLIGWRFRASSDAWLEHRASIERFGDGPSAEDFYKRERALFMMFSAGVSCIESTVYALAAAASHPPVIGIAFGRKEQRECHPKGLLIWLQQHAKAAALVAELDRLTTSDEWRLFVELRNRMTHRSNLPRVINAHVGANPPPSKPLNFAATSSTPAVVADLVDFDALHRWLGSMLRDLLIAGTAMLR